MRLSGMDRMHTAWIEAGNVATHSSERVAASKNPLARSIAVSVFAIELVMVNFGLNIKIRSS